MNSVPELTYFSDLIEHQAKTVGEKPYILFEDRVISFSEFDEGTCKAANGLAAHGARPGEGVAILMGNCPEYLYLFYGLPRGGFYSVPVNAALKGDGLSFILTHSDVKHLVVDDTLFSNFADLGGDVGGVRNVFVRRTTDAPLPPGTMALNALLEASPERPRHTIDPEVMTYQMYTSGTTGFPKGVVTRNLSANVQRFMALSSMLVKPDDVLYTSLPLFHANALMLTAGWAMCMGVPFGLEKRFSASRFWESVKRYGATQFNALGAMIPILMKQPEKPDDADNPVRLVISAACPANLWRPFEKRFGVKIWEAYGAVDGGGTIIINFGNAPVGSVGKPMPGTEWKLTDDDGEEVPPGETGELVVRTTENARRVEYYKNPQASAEKVRGEWLYSGDLFYADQEGNLFFVDRKTDSMRRRGENISSFEVENVVEKHPNVAECAAFGVPSDLGEDEVMIWVKPDVGAELNIRDLIEHCVKNMAYFMIPRYVDVVEEIPRTGTLRVQKAEMKRRGVTDNTWDREKEMPDQKLK